MNDRLKGLEGKPDNDTDIIMWKYDGSNSELTEWHYHDGDLEPKGRWVYDEGTDYDGSSDNPGMVYLDSVDSELEEELGHPTFGEALDKWPKWNYEDKLYSVVDALDDEIEDTMPYVRCKFYSYYGSYFINGDDSGMTDDEVEDCEAFLAAAEEYLGATRVTDVLDDADFGDVEIPKGNRCKGYNGVKFLPGDVCTYLLWKK